MKKRWKALASVTVAMALVFAPLAATGAMADEAVPPEETTEVVAVEEAAPPVEEAAPAAEPEVTTMGGHECEANRGYGHECPPPEPCTMGDSGGPEDCLIVPMITWTIPTCEHPGSIVISEHPHLVWTAVLNEDGSTTYTASSPQGPYYYQFPPGAPTVFTVPNLDQLPEGSCGGGHDEPVVAVYDVEPEPPTCESAGTFDTALFPIDREGYTLTVDRPYDGAGTYTVTATAKPGFEIEGDTSRDIIVLGAIGFQSEDAEAPCYQAPPPDDLIPGAIASQCVGSIPYLGYSVTLPEGFEADSDTPLTITFVNPDGDDYTVSNLPLSGQALWPGAAVNPPTWPGYITNADGTYTATTGNFAWTRNPAGVQVIFEVNPTYVTTVTYPPESSLCANPPKPPTPAALAATGGGDVAPILPIAAGAMVMFGMALTAFGAIRRRIRG